MAEFDNLFVIGDIRHIKGSTAGLPIRLLFELLIDDFKKIYEVTDEVELITLSHFLDDGSRLKVLNIMQKYPQIFDWLGLQDLNVIVLLVLVLAVAGINMISGLLIIILERTNMIGLLKALGAENRLIRNIFLIQSGHIIAKGLFWKPDWTNRCFSQIHFGLIKLDPSYFLSCSHQHQSTIILLNIGTFFLPNDALVPSMVIANQPR